VKSLFGDKPNLHQEKYVGKTVFCAIRNRWSDKTDNSAVTCIWSIHNFRPSFRLALYLRNLTIIAKKLKHICFSFWKDNWVIPIIFV